MTAGKPLSILLIIDTYPPNLGGSEIEAQRVSAALIRRGHRVEVLCAGGPPMPPVREWIDPAGVPVTILTHSSKGRWKDRVFALRVARELWRRRKTYDVVYFLMQGLHLAAGLPVARLLGKPIVMKISGSGVIPFMRASKAGQLELNWMRDWKVPVMLLNEGMMEEAVADGFSRDQLIWMPNPVDVDVFRPPSAAEKAEWRRELDIPADARVVIYVGRLSPEKGLSGLLRGFAQTVQSAPGSVLLLVGDGPSRSQLEQLAAELKLSPRQLRFAGRAPVEEIPRWLGASDIFALTSPQEGFPCALVEAMSVGLPAVVSAIPGNLQLLDDEVNGLAVPWEDAAAIGGALLKLIEEPEVCRRMGSEARGRVTASYSLDAVMEIYEKMFAGVIQRAA